jgi:hypothetical protein
MWKRTGGWFKSRDIYGQIFDPMACACLEYLAHTTGAKVVVSSTWRKSGLQVMKDMFRDRDIDIEVIDITPKSDFIRGVDIEMWLAENDYVTNYVILDDDDDFTPDQIQSHYVDCSGKFGLDHNALVRALKILMVKI